MGIGFLTIRGAIDKWPASRLQPGGMTATARFQVPARAAPLGYTDRVNLKEERRSRFFELRGNEKDMNLTMEIHDDVAQRLSATGGDLSRRALEALVAEEYRQGHLTKPDLRRVLGLETSDQIDGFLKAHQVWIDYTLQDLERERAGLRRLGF